MKIPVLDRTGLAELMAFRVHEVLLVASRYDTFLLEGGGEFSELLFREYRDLGIGIRHAPRFAGATTAAGALAALEKRPIDMVVSTARLPDMSLDAFGRRVRELHPDVSMGVLAAHAWELPRLAGLREAGAADWALLWGGDVKTLVAAIALEEDRRNAERDLAAGVHAIILVEDDIRYLSFVLPHIYTEITRQTSRLMAEGLNLTHRLLRLRARPKILLAEDFEEAVELWGRFAGNVLGIVSDVAFPRGGEESTEAGLEFARLVLAEDPNVPVILESHEAAHAAEARALGATFLHKDSPVLLDDLRAALLERFGFGDFVLRSPDGVEVTRAATVRQLLARLETVPVESIGYHAQRDDFSRWFVARTEFELAGRLRPRKVSEFATLGELRSHIREVVSAYLRQLHRTIIADFDPDRYDEFVSFAKIGSGSLGGKGRGLAFVQRLLVEEPELGAGGLVRVPTTVVLASDIFESFVTDNGLRELIRAPGGRTDEELLDAFRAGRFDRPLRARLARFLDIVREPLAIRSSSILEDSPYQPFAGVYATVMLPNSHSSLDVRLAQLIEAIKVVYASTVMSQARGYLAATPYRSDEESMAVLLQRLVGSERGGCFCPLFSGVASSYNFYPFDQMEPEEGVALVAVGLGKAVVEGYEAMRFCPGRPQMLPQFSAPRDVLRNAQRRYWGLDLSNDDVIPSLRFDANLKEYDITDAARDGSIAEVLSVYVKENDAVVDRSNVDGAPVATFSRFLKGTVFPLPEVLRSLLAAMQGATGSPVEIEFAVERSGHGYALDVLQVRPLVVEKASVEDCAERAGWETVVDSPRALGNGSVTALHDLVVVSPGLERRRTAEVAAALGELDRSLREQGRRYLLIGPGRWGSRDPWLGIPVGWAQIAGAAAIVETDFEDLDIEPSEGSHFFHNLTSAGVSFLAVHRLQEGGRIDWPRLESFAAADTWVDGCLRHLRLRETVEVVVDGGSRRGVVLLGAGGHGDA